MLSTFIKILNYLHPRRKIQFIGLGVLILISSLSEIISIGAIVPFLGVVTNPQSAIEYFNKFSFVPNLFQRLTPNDLVLFFTIAFGAAALISGVIRLVLLYATIRLSNSTGAELSVDLYKKTLYQPYKVHISRNTSEIISGITQKVASASGVLISLVTVASSFFIFISIIVSLVYIDPVLTIMSGIVFSGFYLVIAKVTKSKVSINGQIIAKEQTGIVRSLQEGLGGIRDIILDNSHELYCHIYRTSLFRLTKSNSENTFLNQSPRFALEAIGLVLISFLAYWATLENGSLQSAIPALGALGMGAQRLLPLLQQWYGNWSNYVSLKPALSEVFLLLDQKIPEEYESTIPVEPLKFEKEIKIVGLSFSYPGTSKKVLDSVDLSIPVGSRIGIIGETGSGKSTLMDLLMGLVEPTSGKIFIDNNELNSNNYLRWRKTIAHVPQAIFLADTTIAENIAFGESQEKINFAQLEKAIEVSQLTTFIKSLPDGINTSVGERGVRLSGGQRQRIGIARAIYKNAKVIFFDEATSALDGDTEQSVMDSIYKLSKDLTIFIIAHRMNTISKCEILLSVKKGDLLVDRGKNA
ncbi:ABC transporter ATP-binding protein [Leptospira vanthielii]|uniref:ABC transporter, ATP-binding protein n=1 Tax=Leptospira vanthielii serovar Holland str. Waz Holland = ATCC 700522 TaxID=1218591 RepID=N1W7S0_9LEPT|nr:ABC transporter ATP-binding protein [Leptospira vanthielii]EMY69480.1 ABC transporter, ATP-binding protein [Leptospira vanthielii serovar Holland str. Waz Holland = ATCC 700522]